MTAPNLTDAVADTDLIRTEEELVAGACPTPCVGGCAKCRMAATIRAMLPVYDAAVKWDNMRDSSSLGLFYAAQDHLVAVVKHTKQMRAAPGIRRRNG